MFKISANKAFGHRERPQKRKNIFCNIFPSQLFYWIHNLLNSSTRLVQFELIYQNFMFLGLKKVVFKNLCIERLFLIIPSLLSIDYTLNMYQPIFRFLPIFFHTIHEITIFIEVWKKSIFGDFSWFFWIDHQWASAFLPEKFTSSYLFC